MRLLLKLSSTFTNRSLGQTLAELESEKFANHTLRSCSIAETVNPMSGRAKIYSRFVKHKFKPILAIMSLQPCARDCLTCGMISLWVYECYCNCGTNRNQVKPAGLLQLKGFPFPFRDDLEYNGTGPLGKSSFKSCTPLEATHRSLQSIKQLLEKSSNILSRLKLSFEIFFTYSVKSFFAGNSQPWAIQRTFYSLWLPAFSSLQQVQKHVSSSFGSFDLF